MKENLASGEDRVLLLIMYPELSATFVGTPCRPVSGGIVGCLLDQNGRGLGGITGAAGIKGTYFGMVAGGLRGRCGIAL